MRSNLSVGQCLTMNAGDEKNYLVSVLKAHKVLIVKFLSIK